MTAYLSQETIRAAVERLGLSRGQSALTDYLVFKRALVLANEDTGDAPVTSVVTGTRADPFVAAIDELARVDDGGERPFFSPFGARRDKGRGFKSPKFPSNGPSVTVSGWAARPATPLELVPDTSPKEFAPRDRSADELEKFLLIDGSGSNCSGEKPRLVDLAIWLRRSTAVEESALEDDGAEMVAAARTALGLGPAELDGLFETDLGGIHLASVDAPADPVEYLPVAPTQTTKADVPSSAGVPAKIADADVAEVVGFVAAKGFVFDPWQVAAFITAVRTKPFVILAGISGTGKTKLPRLVADATGAHLRRIAVRPDWTDSSELLGYERLDADFVPGQLLRIAREAIDHPDQQFFALLDEMNVARVEYYLAEVLSHIEERIRMDEGLLGSAPLAPNASRDWSSTYLPGNLCIVGSVNMDETTFGFSRKVLDRSFVIEFSSVSLSVVKPVEETKEARSWDVSRWQVAALSLGEHPLREHDDVGRVVAALETINQALTPVQMQVGYRVRDEIAMFVLGAHDCAESFVGDDESVINPLDLAVAMKVLPRIQGSGVAIRTALERLHGWADPDSADDSTTGLSTESFPFCADRISMMIQRLDETGFTSFWL